MATWADVENLAHAGFPVAKDVHYWDGNSLGPYSSAVRDAINVELDRWEEQVCTSMDNVNDLRVS